MADPNLDALAASGDPVDAMFAHSIAAHGGLSQPSGPVGDPVDQLFATAIANHGSPVPQSAAAAPASQPDQSGSIVSDVLRSGLTGGVKGISAMAGMGGDLRSITAKLLKAGLGSDTGNIANLAMKQLPILGTPTGAEIQGAVGNLAGGLHEPTTSAGHLAETFGEFAPAAVGGEGSLAARLLTRAALPALGSEASAYIAGPSDPALQGAARFAGGVAGGAPSLARTGLKSLGRLLTTSVDPETANLVQAYEGLGGTVRPGQYNASPMARTADSVLAGAPFQPLIRGGQASPANITNAQQADQFGRLVSHTIGEDTTRLTPDVMASAQNRIGSQIDAITSRYSIRNDPAFTAGIAAINNQISSVAPALKAEDVARLAATSNKVAGEVAGGLSGENYQSMRARGGLLQGLSDDSNSTIAGIGQKLRGLLDSTFDRQVPAAAAEALATARNQYRALKTIQPVMDRAPTGEVPMGATLLGRVVSEYGNPNTAGNLGTLARAGKSFLKEQPTSNTSERGFVRALLTSPLKAAGEVAALPGIVTAGRGLNNALNSPQARAQALGAILQNQNRTIPSASFLIPFLAGNQ